MKRWAVALAPCLLIPLAFAAPPAARLVPDFPSQVLPQLTKAGCSTGTCHGAAIGRGGFHLSLLGDDPRADYDAILREYGGRRVRLDTPTASLLLQKATSTIPHGGGKRFAVTTEAYKTLYSWLKSGAPYGGNRRTLARLSLTPEETLNPIGSRVPLTVRAVYTDGTTENVTRLALFDALDDAVATVDNAGMVTIKASGIAVVMVRFRGQVAAARVGAPFPKSASVPPRPPVRNLVDVALFAELARLNIAPSPVCNDATFLRRVHLDLIGTLPTPTEVRAFLTDKAPEKRAKLVDRLLARPEFSDLWTLKLADLLQISAKRLGEAPARAYHDWLRSRVASNTPMHVLVRELLVTDGAANFWRTTPDPRDLSEFFSRNLLGTRVECARCHNHPYDRWSRDDYYTFAASFATRGTLPNPRTGKEVKPRSLGESKDFPGTVSPRVALADWATDPKNTRFATAFTNRVWKELFGRGLVEPVDDLRATNPAVHPKLLTAIAAEFTRNGYNLRELARLLTTSSAYQLDSQTHAGNRRDDRLFSHAALKPLRAYVLADALSQATGANLDLPGRAITLTDPGIPSETLDILGRCRREKECTPGAETGGGLPAALHLLAGTPLNRMVRDGAAKLLEGNPSELVLIEELYLRTLSRFPTMEERTYVGKLLHTGGDRQATVEDILWALVNSREFGHNH